MIRVVIDTNVLVAALLTSGGLPEAVIDLALSGEVQWFASEPVLAEYEEVLPSAQWLPKQASLYGAPARRQDE
jgi:putative PIN family toxin of toxin-antitoxin system